MFLHEGTTLAIGRRLGKVNLETINKKSVVSNRYLRFQVDIAIKEPILAGYFQERNEGDNFWVHYKYERLSDFCYRCRKIDHVTGICAYGEPTMVSTANDITEKLYGPWIKAENSGNLLFMNPTWEDHRRESQMVRKEIFQRVEENIPANCHLNDYLSLRMNHLALNKNRAENTY